MATYPTIDASTPSDGRVCMITDVAEGDCINIVDALGKGAKTLVFYLSDSADVIEYRINNRKTYSRVIDPTLVDHTFVSEALGVFNRETVEVWKKGDSFPLLTETGEEIQINGVTVYSIEIVSLTLSTGSTITIMGY